MENRFTIGDNDYFIKVNQNDLAEANFVKAAAFKKAIEKGCIMRKALLQVMIDQGVWDKKKEALHESLVKEIGQLEYELSSGKMKVSQGRKIAITLTKKRNEFRDLVSERNAMDTNTAEGQADNAKFNFLIACCVYDYTTQKTVYSSVDDYMQKASHPDHQTLAFELASKFASFMYGVDENHDNNLVERKFLKRFKLIDDKGRFVKDGKFVDEDGNLVDEEGYKIDTEGHRLDINGNRVDVDIDSAEFEED
jgi:hypothetical protein